MVLIVESVDVLIFILLAAFVGLNRVFYKFKSVTLFAVDYVFFFFFFSLNVELLTQVMDGNSTGCYNTIGSSSTSSAPSLLDSTMPPMLNDNVECVGVGVGSTGTVGPQNPSSALPQKPKKSEQTSEV